MFVTLTSNHEFLNEVLSLNAQEFNAYVIELEEDNCPQ